MPSFGPISNAPVSGASGATSSQVSTDLAAAYSIAALVGAALVGDYSIAGQVGTVGATLSADYKIAGLAGASLSGEYSIAGSSVTQVSADFSGSYSITALLDKSISITLKSKDLALRPNIGGIFWAWSDARGTVTSSGSGLTANALGQISVPIKTALLSDGTGFLSLDNYTGGNPLDYFAFFGPVRVP